MASLNQINNHILVWSCRNYYYIIIVYSKQNMEKPLFTKIELDYEHPKSQLVAHSLLGDLFQNTLSCIRNKQIQQASIVTLTQQICGTEYNSVTQAYPRQPLTTTLPSDPSTKNPCKQRTRPMSAKINYSGRIMPPRADKNRRNTQLRQSRSSVYSSKGNSRRGSLMVQDKKKRFQKDGQRTFESLNSASCQEDEINQKFINEMRKKKIKESEIEKAKEDFFKTMVLEEEKGNKVRRKWNQTMGSKAFYYNFSGEAVEVASRAKLTKKSQKVQENSRPQTAKRVPYVSSRRLLPEVNKGDNVYVAYKSKDNHSYSNLETFILEDKVNTLFFPSSNCKYQVAN